MDIAVTFPGGVKVDARVKDFLVSTDQSKDEGGGGTAPDPFSYFLASLATCAGFYMLRFCQTRDIPTEGIRLTQSSDWNKETKLVENVVIKIDLPADFPAKYLDALIRAVEQCTVKRVIASPPKFQVSAVPCA